MIKNTFLKTALILTIISMIFSSAGTVIGAAKPITDIGGNWAEKQIKSWIDRGLTNGYKDGTFKPNNTITRAEFIALINRSFGFTEKAEIQFADAKPANWYYNDVAIAVKAAYTTGYTDAQGVQTIGANKKITRQEAAVMIGRLLKLEDDPSGASFSDANEFADWSINVIGAVATTQIMKGYEDSSFKPVKPITRAEAVVSLDRAVTYKNATFGVSGLYGPDTGSKTIDSDVTINAAGVTLQNTIITGNLIISEKVGEGDATLNNVIVKGTTTISGGGVNSVHLNNATLDSVIVNKSAGSVRVVAEGSTRISNTVVQSSAALEEDSTLRGAGFQTVTLEGTGADTSVSLKASLDKLALAGSKIAVSILTGTMQVMDVSETSSNSTLNISATAAITSLVLNSSLKVTGQGTIQSASISEAAANSTFEKPPTIRKDINGVVVKPPTPPAFVSVTAANTGNNVGLGAGDTIVLTFDQNTNKPVITAANLNVWFKLSSGHSFGTSLINSDINWNSTGNILTISLTNITGTTFAVGDTISVQAAAGLKNSTGTTEASAAVSAASTGSFTSSPVISNVTAANTGNNIDKGIGDSVSITFNQNTNRPQIKAVNLNAWLTLSNGHSFGTALTDNNISWNPAGNILTITFGNLTGNTFAIGDTVTVSAAANIRDAQLGASASTSVSPASTGSFTTFLEIRTAVAKNTNATKDLGVGDTIVLTFATPTNHPAITAANFKIWFSDLNVNLTWNSAGDVLTITFLDVTGVTFTVGDMILIQQTAGLRDSLSKLPPSVVVSPATTGSFSDAPKILSVKAANTGNNAGLGIGDSIAITFDQITNKASITGSTINTLLKLSSNHSWGTHLANSDIVWNTTGNVLTVTFSNITGITFAVGDTVTVNKTAAITAALSALESTDVSPASTGSFSPIPATPTVVSVVADDSGKASGLNTGDSLIITFSSATNKPIFSSANLIKWFTLNNGAQFGTTSSQWTANNILTITFTTLPTNSAQYIHTNDIITISAEANIKDSTGVSSALSGSSLITGNFSAIPKITDVVLSDNVDSPGPGLSLGDTIKFSFNIPMKQDSIDPDDLNRWFVFKTASGVVHNLGTDIWNVDWLDDKTLVLTFQYSQENQPNTTVTKGDTVQMTTDTKLYDEDTGMMQAGLASSKPSTGTFASSPVILNYTFDYTNDELNEHNKTTIIITFDQDTNGRKVIPNSDALSRAFTIKSFESPNISHSFGKVNDSDVRWDNSGTVLTVTITKANLPSLTFTDGDILKVNSSIKLKDAAETTDPSTASYPN
jgi:hypothetical protein